MAENVMQQKRPNVLLICVDHWPGRLLNCEGHNEILTPTINQLAANGVRFNRAYSATPSCIPARRALMTGMTARSHGDRVFNETLCMPAAPTMASAFAAAGYQTFSVGKLHVYPQRDRIGFHEAIIDEEGRHHLGLSADDYELFLAEQGFAGQEHSHGCSVNSYHARTFHLPEHCHPTNWTAREMCKAINRRDPSKPSFWFASFRHPHPPLTPLREYMDIYNEIDIPPHVVGKWAEDFDKLPLALKARFDMRPRVTEAEVRQAVRAFYALCTHIDHQIRLIIGTLNEASLINNTIIGFTSDHGDMLGNHHLFAKHVMYEDSVRVPFIISAPHNERLGHHRVDSRLVELRDMMPTLLDLAGIEVPSTVEGISLASDAKREFLYGEHSEDDVATRMVMNEKYKLIWYPIGNRFQLFDIEQDPLECVDLSNEPKMSGVVSRLQAELIKHLYGQDVKWMQNGKLVGEPEKPYSPKPNYNFCAQRGWRFM